jgi:hypothetical protein
MWKIMKALRDVNFDGIVILDHSPTMVGGNYTQTAYGFAYMKSPAQPRERRSEELSVMLARCPQRGDDA